MAFSVRNLSVLAYANGFTLWHYKAGQEEGLETVMEDGFFAPASDMLAGGDLVMLSTPAGGRIMSVAISLADGCRVLRPLL